MDCAAYLASRRKNSSPVAAAVPSAIAQSNCSELFKFNAGSGEASSIPPRGSVTGGFASFFDGLDFIKQTRALVRNARADSNQISQIQQGQTRDGYLTGFV